MEKRRTYTATFNKGLDKYSLPFEANPERALDAMNYVFRDGKVQKRFGLKNILNATATPYRVVQFNGSASPILRKVNSTEINGLWRFKDSYGNFHTIAHIGKLLYELFEHKGVWTAQPIKYNNNTDTVGGVTYIYSYEFLSYKSTAIIGNNALYFLGGNKYMKLTFSSLGVPTLAPVEDNTGTYIPTTTINIAEVGSELAQRQSYDQVNLLSQYRKNRLVGGGIIQHNSPNVHRFVLDAPIVSSDGDPIPAIKVEASFDETTYFDVTDEPALTAESSEPAIVQPTGANLATCDLILTNKNTGESKLNPTLTIVEGEPTRKEAFFPDSALELKVIITIWEETYVTTPDGPVYTKTELSSKTYDFNTFIRYSLINGSHFNVSWSSGASLSAYDGTSLKDSLSISYLASPMRGPEQLIGTNVMLYHDASVITATMKGIELENPINIELPFDNGKTRLENVTALLIDDTDEGAWASSLTGTVELTKATLYALYSANIIYGVVTNYGSTSEMGEIVLFGDWRQPLGAYTNNIEVTFPCYVSGNADKINKCRIAKLFGTSNAKNRLFVSGNPDFVNCDWHSSAYNAYMEANMNIDSNGDFSYFGDLDYCFYGQTDNAIMGYDHVATDKMVVLKSKSKVEPTNYFRTSSLIQAIDASGNVVQGIDGSSLYQESFPLAMGNVSAGAMNINSIVNLNGDTLYLSSENTICGLDIAGQVGDSQRVSYSRSRFIDPELKTLDLSDAVLWTDNNVAYLFADDASYMTNYETFNGETSQYEWLKIDLKSVRCAIEIDGVIFFGCADGKLWKSDKSCFRDDAMFNLSVGATLYANDKITYSSAYDSILAGGSKLTFRQTRPLSVTSYMFRRVCNIADIAINNCDLLIDEDDTTLLRLVALSATGEHDYEKHMIIAEELAKGGPFYLNHVDGDLSIRCSAGSPFESVYGVAFYFEPTIDAEDTYRVKDEYGQAVDFATLALADFCAAMSDEYEITDLDTTNHNFKLKHNGRYVDVVLYGNQDMTNLSFPSEIHRIDPVKSYFIAAPSALGDISYRKTIWAWTMSAYNEPNDLSVCEATNEENLEKMRTLAFADRLPVGFNLGMLSFIDLDLSKSNVPRTYTYFRPLSVRFISFGFKSDRDANSILTSTSIVYTIPMLGFGSK